MKPSERIEQIRDVDCMAFERAVLTFLDEQYEAQSIGSGTCWEEPCACDESQTLRALLKNAEAALQKEKERSSELIETGAQLLNEKDKLIQVLTAQKSEVQGKLEGELKDCKEANEMLNRSIASLRSAERALSEELEKEREVSKDQFELITQLKEQLATEQVDLEELKQTKMALEVLQEKHDHYEAMTKKLSDQLEALYRERQILLARFNNLKDAVHEALDHA